MVEWEFVALGVLEFIGRLVCLIPDCNMKVIRCCGLYARRMKAMLQKVLAPLGKERVGLCVRRRRLSALCVVKLGSCGGN